MENLYRKYKYAIWIMVFTCIAGMFAVNTYRDSMAVLQLDLQEFDMPDELGDCVTDGVFSERKSLQTS